VPTHEAHGNGTRAGYRDILVNSTWLEDDKTAPPRDTPRDALGPAVRAPTGRGDVEDRPEVNLERAVTFNGRLAATWCGATSTARDLAHSVATLGGRPDRGARPVVAARPGRDANSTYFHISRHAHMLDLVLPGRHTVGSSLLAKYVERMIDKVLLTSTSPAHHGYLGKHSATGTATVDRRDGVKLQVRVGLNSGQVIAGDIGSGPFGYTAVGEQVGMAQRMEQ